MKLKEYDEYKIKLNRYFMQGILFSVFALIIAFCIVEILEYYGFTNTLSFPFAIIFIVLLWVKVYLDVTTLNDDNPEFHMIQVKGQNAHMFFQNCSTQELVEIKEMYEKKKKGEYHGRCIAK